jgi:hypothetical protein
MSHYSRYRRGLSSLTSMDGETAYNGLLRIVYVIAGCLGLLASFNFSVEGFNVQYPNLLWLARMIVILCTALQIAFNHSAHRLNITLIVGALVSYGYGIWTNILGLWELGGGNLATFLAATWPYRIIPVSLGIVLETVPETLIVFGMFPDSRSIVSDLVGNITRMFGGGRPRRSSFAPEPYYDDGDDSVYASDTSGVPATSASPTIPRRPPIKPLSFSDRVNELTKDH